MNERFLEWVKQQYNDAEAEFRQAKACEVQRLTKTEVRMEAGRPSSGTDWNRRMIQCASRAKALSDVYEMIKNMMEGDNEGE